VPARAIVDARGVIASGSAGAVEVEEHPRSRSDPVRAVIRPSGCFMDLEAVLLHTIARITDMSTLQHLYDHIIERYTAQPTRLLRSCARQIRARLAGAPVSCTRSPISTRALRLTEAWLALGPRHIAVAKRESAVVARCGASNGRASSGQGKAPGLSPIP